MSSSKRGVSSSRRRRAALAQSVRCDDERVYVTLTNGRVVSAPLPEEVRRAAPKQRRACRVVGYGTAIYWSGIDEEMGVNAILGVSEDEIFELAGFRKGMPEK